MGRGAVFQLLLQPFAKSQILLNIPEWEGEVCGYLESCGDPGGAVLGLSPICFWHAQKVQALQSISDYYLENSAPNVFGIVETQYDLIMQADD